MTNVMTNRMLSRREFAGGLSAALAICLLPPEARSQACTDGNINAWKKQCVDILRDVQNTLLSGDNAHAAAVAKLEAAAEPGFKCAKGGAEVIKAVFTSCNPKSPALNPVECAEVALGIPDTITECRSAIGLVRETLRLLKQAKALYGTAGVAFADSGGYELVEKLAKCNHSQCRDFAKRFEDYAAEARARAERNITRVEAYLKQLEDLHKHLLECAKNKDKCEKIGPIAIPVLEGKGQKKPDIGLP